MSMCLGLTALSDADIERVLRDPPLVWRVVAPDDLEPYERERAARRPSFWARLLGRAPKVPQVADLERPGSGELATDLDKAWHGIHYLLTGTAWEGKAPLNLLVSGGAEVGDVEVGYGPARVLRAEEVRDAFRALEAIRDEELRARFDAEDMLRKEIYPSIWTRKPEEDDVLGYLMGYVGILRAFLAQVAQKGLGLVLHLT